MNVLPITSSPLLTLARQIPGVPDLGGLSGAVQSGATQVAPGTFEKLLAGQLPDGVQPVSLSGLSAGNAVGGGESFATHLIQDTRQLNARASQEVDALVKGEGGSVHNAMIAMEEASVSFQLLVEMRNKVVESLQELMRMQI